LCRVVPASWPMHDADLVMSCRHGVLVPARGLAATSEIGREANRMSAKIKKFITKNQITYTQITKIETKSQRGSLMAAPHCNCASRPCARTHDGSACPPPGRAPCRRHMPVSWLRPMTAMHAHLPIPPPWRWWRPPGYAPRLRWLCPTGHVRRDGGGKDAEGGDGGCGSRY
jgi:hypothetical protein